MGIQLSRKNTFNIDTNRKEKKDYKWTIYRTINALYDNPPALTSFHLNHTTAIIILILLPVACNQYVSSLFSFFS